MKHNKLYSLLLFSALCNTSHADELSQDTLERIETTIRLCNDTEDARFLRRFFQTQKRLARHILPDSINKDIQKLCTSLRSVHFRGTASIVVAYLFETSQAAPALSVEIDKMLTSESKWLHIMKHQIIALAANNPLAIDFTEKVENITTRRASLATLTHFAETVKDKLHPALRERLEEKALDPEDELYKTLSLREKEIQDALLCLKEQEPNRERDAVISMIELYLDYKHQLVLDTNTAMNIFLKASAVATFGSIFSVVAALIVINAGANYNSIFKFYLKDFVSCGTAVCPSHYN